MGTKIEELLNSTAEENKRQGPRGGVGSSGEDSTQQVQWLSKISLEYKNIPTISAVYPSQEHTTQEGPGHKKRRLDQTVPPVPPTPPTHQLHVGPAQRVWEGAEIKAPSQQVVCLDVSNYSGKGSKINTNLYHDTKVDCTIAAGHRRGP